METILENLSMDATAGKLKAITDACDEGLEALSRERTGRGVEPYELREKCLLPLKLALESRVSKLSSHALGGFHKLISDERFQSLVEGDVHRQLPVQFVNAVVSTPSMSDEIQVEIMKMLLMITCSASCEVHGEYLIKIAEVCIETYTRSSQTWTKTACRATLTQMMSSVCNDLEESLKKEMLSYHSKDMPHSIRGLDLISNESSKILTQDVLMLMKHFCSRLSPSQSGSTQQNDVLSLYLEAIFVLVSSLSVAIRQQKDFIDILWQYLCPTLIHLLASPISEVGAKGKNQSAHPDDGGRGGRSVGSPIKSKPLPSIARIIYNISKELVRLVGPMGTMRPVLESLFHRIILYPPPQHRVEALKAINDIFASPSHVVDIAGPVILDPSTPPTPESPTEQKKSEVDLLKVLLDGIVECSNCPDVSVVGGSVACVVGLLGSLEELGQGEGLSQEQVELLKKVEDVDGWEKVEEINSRKTEDSPQTIPKFTLANEAFDEDEKIEVHHGKPKHIRWEMDEEPRAPNGQKQIELNLDQMDLETVTQKFSNTDRLWDMSRTNPDGREQDATEEGNVSNHPKSVHFATDLEEEFTIENREDQRFGRYGTSQRHGIPRRVGLPRRIASSPSRSGVVRRSASFDGKSKAKPNINDRRRVNGDHVQPKILRNDKQRLHRSNSDVGNSPTDNYEDDGLEKRPSVSRSILRKTKPVSETTEDTDGNEKVIKPKGILLNSHLNDFTNKKHGVVKINGILISRSRDPRAQVSPEKVVSGPDKVIEKRKSVEENEREGARNFARCLLGILPSVLSLHDTAAVDEALQQFASDVCEAVTCMALKRKNVPNFGTLRGSSDLLDDNSGKGATSYLHYPILNADGVYAAVFATLKLNLKLHRAGYYSKKQEQELISQQEEFVKNTHNCGVDVGLSSVWLGELYRLVTTYDILEKAGYKADDVSSNRALIELLSDNNRTPRSSEDATMDKAMFIHVQDESSMTITQKQGVKFVRRILLLTWDSLLDVLRVPIESPLVGAVQESIGVALMKASEGQKNHNKERDTVCLSLDGLRRIARLFCTLGIQTGCETVLSQLANASCGEEKVPSNVPKWKAGHLKSKIKLHAAHVLTMDALLAVGLELGSHAPKCWKHVFRCCSYIAGLQNTQFLQDVSDSHASSKVEVPSPISEASSLSDFVNADISSDGSASDIVRQHHDSTPDTTQVLSSTDASRAIYALSTSVDRLFEHAANTLSSDAMVSMLDSLAEASTDQLEKSSTSVLSYDHQAVTHSNGPLSSNLHFCRMVDMLLRCTRDGKRPLLHLMRAWAAVSKHFVKIMCEKKKTFKFGLDLIKDSLVVLLNNRNELPHFWFHETLFKPFENILVSGKLSDGDQDRLLLILCELARSNTGNIKSGWRALCSATHAAQVLPRPSLVTTENDGSTPKILEIITLFVENRTALVFSQAAVNCILCLSKCLHVQTMADEVCDERSLPGSETESNFSEGPYSDMCVPALELLSKVSKKLASIYVKPANVIFHGSHAVKLDNSSSPLSSPSTPIMSVADTVKDASTLAPNYARSITAIDDSGILRVWYLMLDVLTTTVITCPRKYQLQALDTLFDVLHSVSSVPGPQFSILVMTNLLLPMLHSWLEKGTQTPEYWDRTAGNFKQACGLTTELIVGEMGQFLSDQSASECVLTLMRQVLSLLKLAVSQTDEVIARVGCSCFRHLLMSGGALFTEDIWKIICEGLRGAMRSTLAPVKRLIPCYQVGSSSVSGDDGCRVRVLTRRDASWEQTIRHGQLAEQVFLLESQLEEEFDRTEDELPTNEDEDHRTFFFVISSSDNQESMENTTRVPLRGVVVGLLAHQLLLQSLGLVLLEAQDNSFANSVEDSSMPGLLNYLSPANLSIIFDCLMESHTVAYEFNNRFGLRSLIQMIVRLCAPANLLRQSTMAFKFYFQTLLEICRYNGEHMSGSSVKRILLGDRSLSPDEESTHSEKINDHVSVDKDAEWIVRRLSEACSQLSSVYNRLYSNYENVAAERNLTSTPDSSPSKLRSHFGDDSLTSIRRKIDSPDILRSDAFCSRDREHLNVKKHDEMLQLRTWTAMTVDMLEAILHLPILQFKPILPAIYPAVTSMIPVSGDTNVCRLIYEVVTRGGSIYGIV